MTRRKSEEILTIRKAHIWGQIVSLKPQQSSKQENAEGGLAMILMLAHACPRPVSNSFCLPSSEPLEKSFPCKCVYPSQIHSIPKRLSWNCFTIQLVHVLQHAKGQQIEEVPECQKRPHLQGGAASYKYKLWQDAPANLAPSA